MWIMLFLLLSLHPSLPAVAAELASSCVPASKFGDTDGYPLGEHEERFVEQLLIQLKETFEEESEEGKKKFLMKLAPSIIQVMSKVEKERDFLLTIPIAKVPLSKVTEKRLQALQKKYRTDDLAELRLRVNVVPLDMVLAQAAEESSWGNSALAKKCFNYFGIHKSEGMSACRTPSRLLAKFSDPKEAIEFYVLNLNRHQAYSAFRTERQRLLKQKVTLTGNALIGTLHAYSTGKGLYSRRIKNLIRTSELGELVHGAIQQTKNPASPSSSQKEGFIPP